MMSLVIAKSNKNLCLKLNVIKIPFRTKIVFEKSMKNDFKRLFLSFKNFMNFLEIL